MQISIPIRTAPHSAVQNARRTDVAGVTFAAQLNAASEIAAAVPALAAEDPIDFSSATRKELFDWMNAQIRSGKMSLDESTPFLGMTLCIDAATLKPVDMETDTTRINFMDKARDGVEWAESRFDFQDADRWQRALETMREVQKESGIGVRRSPSPVVE